MSEHITAMLKRALDGLESYGNLDGETRRNALKEELQFYVLNFIYHHPTYSSWIMYGGSALRIIHGLDRMSVDLDFEISHEITEGFLEEAKKDIEEHFKNTYGAEDNFLTIKITAGRGLVLKFHVGEALSSGNPSQQVHVKIDLNHFAAPTGVTERRPINHDQLSFVIMTYTMSTLMASKIAAIFLRGIRGVGGASYEEKGRDIYDLLWYMGKKIVPDISYLRGKNVEEAKDIRTLFEKLTIKMNSVSDENLKQDLSPLFINRTFTENWLQHWRETYGGLLNGYKIHTIKELERIVVSQDFRTDIFSFVYWYGTEEGKSMKVMYTITDHWIDDVEIAMKKDTAKEEKIEIVDHGSKIKPATQEKLKQYAMLFLQKTEEYLKHNERIIIGDEITTKLIRTTAEKLNQREQTVLNKASLISCELEDLLK